MTNDPLDAQDFDFGPNGIPDYLIPQKKVELPSLTRKRKARFMPAISELLYDRLMALPGKCLGIYLLLLQRSRIEKQNPVLLTNIRLANCGVDRRSKRRALDALEAAGLIRVVKRDRKNPLVELLDAEDETVAVGEQSLSGRD